MNNAQQLKNIDGISFEDLEQQVRLGARFVVYQYAVSLLAVTLKRLTAIYYIPPDVPANTYKSTANRISYFFGWWGIPWGPIYTIQSITANNKGGVDVTKDIMVNITKEDFENNRVILNYVYSPYHTPNKTETECLRKSLSIFMQRYPDIAETYFGLYVNEAEPFFVIGLPEKYTEQFFTDELKKILYKSFNKTAYFEFLNIDEENEAVIKLKELGLKQM